MSFVIWITLYLIYWMNIVGDMLSLINIVIVIVCLGISFAEVCFPDDNKYYHQQMGSCYKCDTCIRGFGKDTVKVNEKIKWDKTHGALTCTPCKRCPSGQFNDRRDYYCKPCKDCARQNRYELLPCSMKKDAICGGLIRQDEYQSTDNTRLSTSVSHEIYSTVARHDMYSTVLASSGKSTEDVPDLLLVIVIVGPIALVISLLACVLFLRKKLRDHKNKFTVNNLEQADPLQRIPLVTMNNRTETTPKMVVPSNDQRDDQHSEAQHTLTISNSTTSGSKVLNRTVKTNNKPLLCCGTIFDPPVDDVSKTCSISSGCSELFSDNLMNERNGNSREPVQHPDTCFVKRSNCSLLSNSYSSRYGSYNSPSYFCKCYSCSSTV